MTSRFWKSIAALGSQSTSSPALPSQQQFTHLRPIVIGGCARSGTTLLLSILSSHPQIFAIPFETQALCRSAYYVRKNQNKPLKLSVIWKYLSTASIPIDCQYWCEKTPRNVLFFREILEHFGESVRVIHIVRDGRDVVCSIHPDDTTQFWVSPERWIQDVQAGLAVEQDSRVLTLRYEDLVTHFDKTTQTICEFLNLDVTDHLKDYPTHATVTKSNAWIGPARLPTRDSVGQWRTDRFRSRAEQVVANPDAVKLLRHYGYL